MKSRLVWIMATSLFLVWAFPASAGQFTWSPGGEQPTLSLDLGDTIVRKTFDLPSGSSTLRLVLIKALLTDENLIVTWKNDGELWFRQAKKIPGAETTAVVALPPGRRISLEVATAGGTPVASITLRRK